MAYQCLNVSNQYFALSAPNISVPPVTFSLWINVSAVVAKHTALYLWRGGIDTGLLLRYVSTNWELRYYVAGGSQWQTSTGLNVSTGAWQHACLAVTSSQARLYLGGTSFTNNVSHATANLNAAGDVGRDPFPDAQYTSFNGSLAGPAIWNVALTDAECLALARRVSPLALKSRLANLVLYRNLIRDPSHGHGPTLTPVNSPTVDAHPPVIYPAHRMRAHFNTTGDRAPYRLSSALAIAGRVEHGCAESVGAAAGITLPLGEVSS